MKYLFLSACFTLLFASSCNSGRNDQQMSDSTIMSDSAHIDTNTAPDTLILDSSVVM